MIASPRRYTSSAAFGSIAEEDVPAGMIALAADGQEISSRTPATRNVRLTSWSTRLGSNQLGEGQVPFGVHLCDIRPRMTEYHLRGF